MRAPPRRCRDATAQRPPSLKTARALARCLRGEPPFNRRSRSSSPRPAGSVTARSGAHSHKTWQSLASHSLLYCINCLSLTGFPLLYKKPVPYGLSRQRVSYTVCLSPVLPPVLPLYCIKSLSLTGLHFSPRPAGSVTARSGAHSHKTSQSAASHSPLYCIKSLSLTGFCAIGRLKSGSTAQNGDAPVPDRRV
jgi:hypothetical protein